MQYYGLTPLLFLRHDHAARFGYGAVARLEVMGTGTVAAGHYALHRALRRQGPDRPVCSAGRRNGGAGVRCVSCFVSSVAADQHRNFRDGFALRHSPSL